jgi:hypothetical protein
MKLISLNNTERGPPKEQPNEVQSKLAKRFRRRCLLKEKVPYISLYETCDPRGMASFDPRGII